MGGSSSSSQATNTTNIREDYIFNNAGGGTSANVGQADYVSNEINVTTADPEVMRDALAANATVASDAFAQAFGFGNDAIAQVGDTVREALTQATDSIENQQYWTGQAINQSLGTVKSIGTGGASDNADVLKWAVIAAAVVGAAVVFKG